MNQKVVFCAVLLWGGATAVLCGGGADTDSLRIVVDPPKTGVHFQEVFTVGLRVENPTSTDQIVRVMSCGWYDEWKASNTNLTLDRWGCDKNIPKDVVIPPGRAYTNQLGMYIIRPISEKTLSFRMGFTPIDSQETFWGDEVTLNILPPENPMAGCAAAPKPIDCLVDRLSSNGAWFNGYFPILGLPETVSTAQLVSKVFEMTGFADNGRVRTCHISNVQRVHIKPFSPGLYTAVLVQTDVGEKIVLLKYEGQTVGWWSRVFDL